MGALDILQLADKSSPTQQLHQPVAISPSQQNKRNSEAILVIFDHRTQSAKGWKTLRDRREPAQMRAKPFRTGPRDKKDPIEDDASTAHRRLVHRGRRRSLDNMHAVTTRNVPDQQQLQQKTDQRQITQSRGRRSKSGAPAVRLDMDLELDVELKAKINGVANKIEGERTVGVDG
ncbi:hypothetical protein SODALDRAFT_374885 [Sodiomyces alkalinus F11]|uniref:Uncharacterized protein n=1 Tax=Sodiomyces alkalinus (strain CBS 110278 / VKM F-3762 / F11) TaxID=1314773 RepID=A0A3N2Q7B5_SODAK|nr:hypothetical protein SODALDRAFT_374885 [Sodiomyces alkalinus F11]ROT42577.1 hypothetical protein SODALDRAFT_374885 [Sodiomyces alkalinus F11]